MSANRAAHVKTAVQGERLSPIGVRIRMIATADDTAGAASIFECSLPAGAEVPPHIHTREDEYLYVVSGRFHAQVGDDCKVLGPGGSTIMPRGIAHGFRNVALTESTALIVATPGGFEQFFRAIAASFPATPRPQDFPAVREIFADHGMTLMT